MQRSPCEYAPFFSVLQQLHARLVTGSTANGSDDASITVLELQWDRDSWPMAHIASCTHAAYVVDVCTSAT